MTCPPAYKAAGWFSLGVAAGLGLALGAYLKLQQKRRNHRGWVLAVTVDFETEEQKQQFLSTWRPLLAYVEKEEPGTLSYQLLESEAKPTRIMIYERYFLKDDYINDHKNSISMLEFKQAVAALPFKVEIAGESWVEKDMGWMLQPW